MSNTNQIGRRFPVLGKRLGRVSLAALPTPVKTVELPQTAGNASVVIKCDHLAGKMYGGNKVRKLEYALQPAVERHRQCIATFGSVGSHHALATAVYAKQMGLECLCFLSHQSTSPAIGKTLAAHLGIGTTIVKYGGAYASRVATLRQHLWGRNAWVVPLGGSSWHGTVGFVDAAFELAAQIENGELEVPDRIYIAAGTMGSAAGLAIGLALAGLRCRVEAVRVAAIEHCNQSRLRQLTVKTIGMMRRLDRSIPSDLGQRINLRLRDDFFGQGYGRSDDTTEAAVEFARDTFDLELETTYTGKTMAALVSDLPGRKDRRLLFWNTYNSAKLPQASDSDPVAVSLPEEFRKYLP